MENPDSIVSQYLSPACLPSTLDSFGNRRLILAALRANLPRFSGAVLDVGCGHKPYKSSLLSPPSRASRYIGLDLPANLYGSPDLEWDGRKIPLENAAVDSVLLTEVLEHCPQPDEVLQEIARVMKPGGFLFLTVPFIWPIHTVPHDEYRYTPFALRRLLDEAGFLDAKIEATGGRHAVLALTLGLWVRRRPLTSRRHVVTKYLLSLLLWPVIWLLLKLDRPPAEFEESAMLVGLTAAATRSP
ncbi:MAG: class I SAM-dependent methyltransferase [Xanthobacteraceae bacterium]